LKISATNSTPEVSYSQDGVFLIKGISVPEKATEFYSEIYSWIDTNVSSFPDDLHLKLQIEYMNTPSKKHVILLLTELINLSKIHQFNLLIDWIYDHEIEDVKEEGEIIQDIVNFPFNFITQ
jgi:hypothetical protein